MKLQKFNGGLSTRQEPQMLNLNEGVRYSNIDNESGILKSVKSKTATSLPNNKYNYFYTSEQLWVSSEIFRRYTEFQKTLYYSDGINKPKKFNGIIEQNLGIEAPTASVVVTQNKFSEPPKSASLLANSAGDLPNIELTYAIFNSNDTYVSAPLEASINLITSTSDIITLSEDLFGKFSAITVLGEVKRIALANVGSRSVTITDVAGMTYDSGGVKVYRLYEGKYYLVGTLADKTDSIIDDVYDISGNTEFDENTVAPIAGTVQYVYTYYNSVDGTESAPSPASQEQEALSNIILSNISVSADTQVDKKRIYRIGGFLSEFALVAEIDNNITEYNDITEDTAIIGTILDSTNNLPAPEGLNNLTEAFGMLFGAIGSSLRFTPVGSPNYWPAFYEISFNRDITGIGYTPNGLLVMTTFETYIVTGTGPTSLAKYPLSLDQGCIAEESIQQVETSCVWVSTDGICASSGSNVKVITKEKLGNIDLVPVDSIVFDEVYYLVQVTGILALDYRYGLIIKELDLNISTLAKANDVLYGWESSILYTLLDNNVLESFDYLSPRFVEGRMSEEKKYKKIYVHSKGTVELTAFINDVAVKSYVLEGFTGHELQIPVEKQRGYFIQFSISGVGEVSELEYEVAYR